MKRGVLIAVLFVISVICFVACDGLNDYIDVPVESVTLNKSEAHLNIGDTEQLTASVLPIDATVKVVLWSSSDTAVATVDKGVVTALAAGETVISAVTVDGNKSAVCAVTVFSIDLVSISIKTQPVKSTYKIGESLDLSGGVLTASFSDDTTQEIQMTSAAVNALGFDSSAAGNEQVSLTYGSKSASIDVKVLASLKIISADSVTETFREAEEEVTLSVAPLARHSFEGWYTDEDFSEKLSSESIKMPNRNMEVFARWIEWENVIFAGGSDGFATITEALEAVQGGGVIFVRPGEYFEELKINKPVTLLGNNYAAGDGERLAETVLYPVSNANFNITGSAANIEIASSNVKIKGFTLNGDNPNLSNLLTASMQTIFADKTSNGYWSYNREGLTAGDELGVDGYAGIAVRCPAKTTFGGIVICGNIITNYNDSGVLVEADGYSTINGEVSILICDNTISNIMGYGETNNGAAWGCYGLGINLSGGLNTAVIANRIMNTVGGIQYYGSYSANSVAYAVKDNVFINNSVGIWINSQTGPVAGGQVFEVSGNTIYNNDDFVPRSELNALYTSGILNTYGITVTSSSRFKLYVFDNTVSEMRYALVAGNVAVDCAFFHDNTVANCYSAIVLTPTFTRYSFAKNDSYMTAYGNRITDCENEIEIGVFNTGKFAKVYTLVEIFKDGELAGTEKLEAGAMLDQAALTAKYGEEDFFADAELKNLFDFSTPLNVSAPALRLYVVSAPAQG